MERTAKGYRRRKLTPKQRKAANLLALGYNQTETAKQIGVAGNTVWTWMNKHESFRNLVEKIKNEFDTKQAGEVAGSMSIETLIDELTPEAKERLLMRIIDKLSK